ncbi:MAG TPA: hypothetical protein VEH76_09000 [Methylocystis sp.]|nr:hypothetical protein [Methylocystis sp.]
MKAKVLSGSAIAISAVALVLAGATPALAKRHHHHHHKAEKGKASCKQESGAPPAEAAPAAPK